MMADQGVRWFAEVVFRNIDGDCVGVVSCAKMQSFMQRLVRVSVREVR